MPLDLDHVRNQFPALDGDWAFFDNAGGSQVLRPVAERISDYLLTTSVQTGASYETSRHATERLAEARARLALLFNARRAEEVVFGASTTMLLKLLATAMAGSLAPGDEIVVTEFDHESNIGPWVGLRERGVVVKFWPLNKQTLQPDLADLEALMGPRTKLVCVTHASNILGTINPIREIADLVHRYGARICVDGVAYAPHRAIDVQAVDCDYYVFSLYKTYGPHLAVLYGKYDHLLELDGLYHYFYGRDKVPMKLEPGNPAYELAWGSAAIVDYLEELGGTSGRASVEAAFQAVTQQEMALAEHLLAYLRGRNTVRILGDSRSDGTVRVPTISFLLEGADPLALIAATDAGHIGIRHGDFHSRRLVESLGLPAQNIVRASLVHYNTLGEVDRFIDVLDRAT
ncbi:cysteine desulfurase-like protein [Rhizobiales bacterium 3FA27D7]|jgi:cysteine desulfurase family protein (TIGR01976 family)|uniref:cysteine desulfurase-like protein n=1 Tax=Mesorhizobium sp. 2RAF21 TaxID=3232995 RepID=UPI0010F875E2